MAIFYLKENDTRPTLQVTLTNPDGTAYDLTNVVTVYLNITLSDGTDIQKTMTVDAVPTTGIVTYIWLAADWGSSGLAVGPSPQSVHTMEYEVVGPGTIRLTFPNDGYDTLSIVAELGQGA